VKAREIRVLLVDGHAMVRAGLRQLIDASDGLKVVGEAGDTAGALALTQSEHPDVVVLELELEEQNAIDFLPELHANGNGSRVLILTGLRDGAMHKQAIRLGARGILLKHGSAASLVKAIRKVHEGELWIERSMTADLITDLNAASGAKNRHPQRAKIDSLTPREREVIVLVGKGLKNKAIAQRLSISDSTVRHHLTAIFSKLGVADRLSLVLYAVQNGLSLHTSREIPS
jgi:two-component system nitrate/nitrite response regulator NarL